MRGVVLLCVACFLGLLMAAAFAQDRGDHDTFHLWYRGLKSPEGQGCCNERDCHPVASRYTAEGPEGGWVLEILIRNRWVKVPQDRILPVSSPDGGVHACYSDPAPFYDGNQPRAYHSLRHCRRLELIVDLESQLIGAASSGYW
jgi:hypothetical protein